MKQFVVSVAAAVAAGLIIELVRERMKREEVI